jgi:glutamate synthase (NADPH/NADH) large chain
MVTLTAPTADDLVMIHSLVLRHHEETGSVLAKTLLDDWQNSSAGFTKVFPKDFERVLKAKAEAEAKGEDVVAAIMAASNG